MSEFVVGHSVAFSNPLQAVILVGGQGARLRPLVSDRPKPMAEVGGRPFLEWLLVALRTQGIQQVVLCIGYMGKMVQQHFGDGANQGLEIVYSEESELLGTGGALRRVLPLLRSDPVLVLNGDSYCEVDLATFFAWHRAHKGQGSLVLTHVQNTGRYGRVRVNGSELIVGFEEKGDASDPGWINAGIYLLSRHFIASIPTNRPVSLEREVFPRWGGLGLYGYPRGGAFLDIGTPESYTEAGRFIAEERLWTVEREPQQEARLPRSEGSSQRYVLLDRDGTLNVERSYLSDPGQVELLPGVLEGLRRLQELGLRLVVVTNQSGMGRGFFEKTRLETIHGRLRALLAAGGVSLDGIYSCPHRPEEDCGCRKPAPGLVEQAAKDLGFDPQQTFVIGDKACDIDLGRRLGALTILVTTGYGAEMLADPQVRPDFVVDSLPEAAQVIEHLLTTNDGRMWSRVEAWSVHGDE